MEDAKKDVNNRTKRTKSELIKNTVHCYLQKRNYSTIGLLENTTLSQQLQYSLIESEVSKSNSILYSCYNNDPTIIDHNFEKFLLWLKNNHYHDLDNLIGPLFCHFYIEIQKGGHIAEAAQFFKTHFPTIDQTKCDDFTNRLINAIANINKTNSELNDLKEQFRSNKYALKLTPESVIVLKKFILDNCHVIFLHILQTWFDLQETAGDKEATEAKNETTPKMDYANNGKYKKMLECIDQLNKEPQQIHTINITNTKEPINCALLRRNCNLIAFNQRNAVHLRPVHSYDSILGYPFREIQLLEHTKQVYKIALSNDGRKLATTALDCNLCLYDINPAENDEIKLIAICTGHLGVIYDAKISSNNAYVASASHDNTARLWDLHNGNLLRIFIGHQQSVTCLDFHPNCLYLTSGSADHNLRLWNLDNGNVVRLFHGCKGVIYDCAVNPMGQTLASASDDRRVRLWELLTAKILLDIKYDKSNSDGGKCGIVTMLLWNDNGKQLCAGSLDGFIRIWDFNLLNEATDKCLEPILIVNTNSVVFHLDFTFGNFGCITAE